MGRRRAVESIWLTSFHELISDLRDLCSLARSVRDSASARAGEVSDATTIPVATRREQGTLLEELRDRLDGQVCCLRRLTQDMRPERTALTELQDAKEHHASLLRSRLALWGGLGVASDWNSPSIDHSVISNAGRESGSISPFLDDYKRDRHAPAAAYERSWLREYVDAPSKDHLRVLVTSCGMSAFTTVAHLLRLEKHVSGPLLIGRGSYHECRDLLRSGIAGREIIEVDEGDRDGIMSAVRRHSPSGIYLDSAGNNPEMTFPDLEGLLHLLAGAMDGGTVVVDNTGRAVTFQPWHLAAPRLRMIVFESATKYAQLGLDRTPAGVIVCSSADGTILDALREHLGTNITDTGVGQLLSPDRALMERRLGRIDRNAAVLAAALWIHVEQAGLPLVVHHPSLPDHPAYGTAKALRFRGGSLSIELAPTIDDHRARARLIELIIEEARARNLPLVHGTSFGFDITRVYLTAAHAESGTPFVRISAGTEHALQVVALGRVLRGAISRLCTELRVSRTRGSCSIRSASHRKPATFHPM